MKCEIAHQKGKLSLQVLQMKHNKMINFGFDAFLNLYLHLHLHLNEYQTIDGN